MWGSPIRASLEKEECSTLKVRWPTLNLRQIVIYHILFLKKVKAVHTLITLLRYKFLWNLCISPPHHGRTKETDSVSPSFVEDCETSYSINWKVFFSVGKKSLGKNWKNNLFPLDMKHDLLFMFGQKEKAIFAEIKMKLSDMEYFESISLSSLSLLSLSDKK